MPRYDVCHSFSAFSGHGFSWVLKSLALLRCLVNNMAAGGNEHGSRRRACAAHLLHIDERWLAYQYRSGGQPFEVPDSSAVAYPSQYSSQLKCTGGNFTLTPWTRFSELTYWGWVTYTCTDNLTIIGSGNGLSPDRRQAITWTNDGILFIGPLGTNFGEILIKLHTFSFKKMHLKMLSAKRRPFCLRKALGRVGFTTLKELLTCMFLVSHFCWWKQHSWSCGRLGVRNYL